MKQVFLIITVAAALSACSTRKTETTQAADSLAIDSLVLADVPAPASLAYSLMPGYTARTTFSFSDSVNFILLANQEELEKNFALDKTVTGAFEKPDFIINHIVGIVCMPSQQTTTITLDKVEVGESAVNVYVNIKRGEKQAIAAKPTQIYAIEKRDGIGTMQFYVNGKIDKAFFLTGLP